MIRRDGYMDDEFEEISSLEERDEEYARRIRAEIQHLEQEQYERLTDEWSDDEREDEEESEGEGDEELKDDVNYMALASSEESSEEQEAEGDSRQQSNGRPSFWWLLVSGNILIREGLTKYYGQMVIVAALFLLSIIIMFWSLHLDMEYNALGRDVQLLRERSVRLQEVRFSRTSHSSIVEELERRGIDLVDPSEPATVIKKRRW